MIFDDDDDTHMGTCNDGVRAGSPAFSPGKEEPCRPAGLVANR